MRRASSITHCVLLVIFLSGGYASADLAVFNDFSDTSQLTMNGNAITTATGDGTVLRLTSAFPSQSGSAFSTATVNAATFSTYFRFRITNPGGTLFDGNTDTGADGIVFVVQSVSSSIGGAGGGIGYAGIPSSAGVEFDTWHNSALNDPGSNHLGIDINGSVHHGSGSANTLEISPRFDDGNIWHAWVDYDGTDLEARVNQTGIRPGLATLSRTLDIPTILGADDAYVGFTSGTGADWGNHDILSWEYRDEHNPVVPTPSALVLGVLGLGIAGRKLRRRRTA